MKWILVVAMFSPGGDFIGKYEMPAASLQKCNDKRKVVQGRDEFGIDYRAICVTFEHWQGIKPMPKVPMD
jgi:hypothetical protein